MPAPSAAYLLLDNLHWESLNADREEAILDGLRSWEINPQETWRGRGLLQVLLEKCPRQESPFLNETVQILLDKGVDPASVLDKDLESPSQGMTIKWQKFPTLLQVLGARARGASSTQELDLGLALLSAVGKPTNGAGEALKGVEGVLAAYQANWATPIEGMPAVVWLLLRSVKELRVINGWTQPFSGNSVSASHQLRLANAIHRSALSAGALSEEESLICLVAKMALAQIWKSRNKQDAVIYNSLHSLIEDKKFFEAARNKVDALFEGWAPEGRTRFSMALLKAASEGLPRASLNHDRAWRELARWGVEMGLRAEPEALAPSLCRNVLQYWSGNLKETAKIWSRTDDSLNAGIALWAASWGENKATSGSLVDSNRTSWLQALADEVMAQDRPLGNFHPAVQKLVSKALLEEEAVSQWRPLAACVNHNALDRVLPSVSLESTPRPRF